MWNIHVMVMWNFINKWKTPSIHIYMHFQFFTEWKFLYQWDSHSWKLRRWCYSLGSHCSRNNNLAADLQLISAPSLPCMWSSLLMMANDTRIVKVTQRGEQIFPTHSHTYNILATTGLQVRKVKMSWVWVLNRQQSL